MGDRVTITVEAIRKGQRLIDRKSRRFVENDKMSVDVAKGEVFDLEVGYKIDRQGNSVPRVPLWCKLVKVHGSDPVPEPVPQVVADEPTDEESAVSEQPKSKLRKRYLRIKTWVTELLLQLKQSGRASG